MAWLEQRRGAARDRVMGPCVQSVWRDGRKPLWGLARIQALPARWWRDAARMRRVGVQAPQVRQGGGPRGRPKRQGKRPAGPLGPEPLAHTLVPGHVRALDAWCNGVLRAVAQAGIDGQRVTGLAYGPDRATPARDPGCGPATRTRRLEDTPGQGHASAGTVDGGQGLLRIAAVTKRPLAVQGGPSQEHEARWTRALGTPARAHGAG
jgi:hypothetical protein